MLMAPKASSELADCRARTQPVKKPVRMTMGMEPTPMESIWVKTSSQ